MRTEAAKLSVEYRELRDTFWQGWNDARDRPKPTVSGVGILGPLGVVFVTLKLCGVIDCSWWWATVPFWGVHAVTFTLLLLVLLVMWIARILATWRGQSGVNCKSTPEN